jgi:hypothetical protein
MTRTILVSSILLLIQVPCFSLPDQAPDAQAMQKSCGNFVQSFYDWYIKQLDSSNGSLKDRPSAFSPELYRALMDDMEAQAKADEIVGLDWDPILSGNGRPFGDHYVVGRITIKSEAVCWVEMHDTPAGKKSDEPVVAAELVNKGGQWRFVNFYYVFPKSGLSTSISHGGLLTILKNLREARQEAAKKPPAAKPAPQFNSGPTSKPTPATKPTPQN